MIIGLTGKRLSGKDTAGKHLVDKHGFHRVAFADKLREAVAALFEITPEQVNEYKSDGRSEIDRVEVNLDVGGSITYSFRWVEFLQRFGTEMAREVFGWDFWVLQALPERAYTNNEQIVITDVRFENEAQRILDLGGTIIQINRPSLVDKSNDDHQSEAGIPESMIDYVIENEGTLEDLYRDVDEVLEDILHG